MRRLNADPTFVTVFDEFEEETYEIPIDGNALLAIVKGAFSSADLLGLLPSAIAAISAGDTEPLSFFASLSTFTSYGFAEGMYFSVMCAEEVPFNTPVEIERASGGLPPELAGEAGTLSRSLAGECEAWQTPPLPEIENAPVVSDVRALVLAGHFDSITPPSYGRRAAETLSRAYYFEFPAAGHGVLAPGCPMMMLAAFLNDLTVSPDLGCHGESSLEFLITE